MSVQLLAIKFNHNSGSAAGDALNIRKNATQFVTVPEWQFGVSVNPEDSPAAYAIAETQGNTITIQAKFRRLDESIQSAEIRALDPTVDPPPPHGCIEYIIWLLRAIIRALFGNVLGDVKAKTVAFQKNGETAFETFELQHVRLADAGVGIRTTTWRWQYRVNPGDPWTDFQNTTHRIYSILALPTAPWNQAPYNSGNTQLPWTEVLDYSCNWAFLMGDRDTAAGRVTSNVYNLGPSVVTYDCPGGGSSHYSWGSFDCTAFLDRLRGGTGNGIYVNCSDCATITSSFSNILGCDLWQSEMGYYFDLNPILGIGSNVWQTACGWGGFSYHEVAWKGACTSNDNIFDACLQVDGDADPTTAPHTPLLPVNMRFGNVGQDYRFRLATAATQADCDAQPGTRQRRTVI